MDLKSGYPFWTVRNGLPAAFPPLRDDRRCDVAIIGAGITGAVIAEALHGAGLDVVVLDRRDAAWGSTAASTALLQYEIDTELAELARRFGEEHAVAAYRACEQAIASLRETAARVGSADVVPVRSLYLASRRTHVGRLREECALRRKHGFGVDGLERAQLLERYGLEAPFALLTEVASQTDPYRLTWAILTHLQARGVGVFDRSPVAGWHARPHHIEVELEDGASVRCRHLVVAAGYESQQYLRQRVAVNHSSYALVTEPVQGGPGLLQDHVLWESARPYLYLRSTDDGRVLVGGEDDRVDIAIKRDALVPRKSKVLLRKLARLLPGRDLEIGFAWAGTFAETADALPFFGPHEQHGPNVHFALAYGGNGIVFSVIGAQILRARLLGTTHPLQEFFSFARLR